MYPLHGNGLEVAGIWDIKEERREYARSRQIHVYESQEDLLADETVDLVVISDDVSLDVGQIRIRKKGSAGGHNGLKNIIAHLGHDVFIRVKILPGFPRPTIICIPIFPI